MYVDEVAATFREYVDENDESWMDAAAVARYLRMAYDDFRKLVGQYDQTVYQFVVDLTLAGVSEYDLGAAASAVRLLGNPAGGLTGARLERIIEILTKSTPGPAYAQMPWVGVKSLTELSNGVFNTYLFSGTKLTFAYDHTADLRMVYRGIPSVDWTKQTAGQNERIDDLETHHELIALLACKRYFVRDGDGQAAIRELMQQQIADLQREMCLGRDFSGSTRMSMTYNP